MIWNIRCTAEKNSAGIARHPCIPCMSSKNLGEIWSKCGLLPQGLRPVMHLCLMRRKKQRPPGEEVRRALLISIGSLGGGGPPIQSGNAGRRSAAPDRWMLYSPGRQWAVAPDWNGTHARAACVVRACLRRGATGWILAEDRAGSRCYGAARKNNNARWGRRSSGRHIGDWQLGGGVLPIVSERRWEEECVAPNSCRAPFLEHRVLGIMPGVRPIRPPVPLSPCGAAISGLDRFRSDGCTIPRSRILCSAIWAWMICALCMPRTAKPFGFDITRFAMDFFISR